MVEDLKKGGGREGRGERKDFSLRRWRAGEGEETGRCARGKKRGRPCRCRCCCCCCITLNLPEYLPSEPYDVYPLTNAHGTQASSLSSLSFSRAAFSLTLLFTPASYRLVRFLSPFLSRYPSFSLLILGLLAQLTHPFLTLGGIYRVCRETFPREVRTRTFSLTFRSTRTRVIEFPGDATPRLVRLLPSRFHRVQEKHRSAVISRII